MNVCTALRRFALAASLALAACGGGGGGGSSGGGGSGGDDESSISWDRSTYTIDTRGKSSIVSANAVVTVTSPHPVLSIGVNPPTIADWDLLDVPGPYPVNQFNEVPITFVAEPDSEGLYRTGKYVFEAEMKIGDKKYTDRTTLVVK